MFQEGKRYVKDGTIEIVIGVLIYNLLPYFALALLFFGIVTLISGLLIDSRIMGISFLLKKVLEIVYSFQRTRLWYTLWSLILGTFLAMLLNSFPYEDDLLMLISMIFLFFIPLSFIVFTPSKKLTKYKFINYLIVYFKRLIQGGLIAAAYTLIPITLFQEIRYLNDLLYNSQGMFILLITIYAIGGILLIGKTPLKYVFVLALGIFFRELLNIDDGDITGDISFDAPTDNLDVIAEEPISPNIGITDNIPVENPLDRFSFDQPPGETGLNEGTFSYSPEDNLNFDHTINPYTEPLVNQNIKSGLDFNIDINTDGLDDTIFGQDLDLDNFQDDIDFSIDKDHDGFDDNLYTPDIDHDNISDDVDFAIDSDQDQFDDSIVTPDNDNDGFSDNGLKILEGEN
jgi:hypothetical protein